MELSDIKMRCLGSLGEFNLRLTVNGSFNAEELTAEDRKELEYAIWDHARAAMSDTLRVLHLKSDAHKNSVVAERSLVRRVFSAYTNVVIHEAPNAYAPEGSNYPGPPWFQVYTNHGVFTLGRRKRVHQLSWSGPGALEGVQGLSLFAEENTTKCEDYIHAHNEEDLHRYVATIVNEVTRNCTSHDA